MPLTGKKDESLSRNQPAQPGALRLKHTLSIRYEDQLIFVNHPAPLKIKVVMGWMPLGGIGRTGTDVGMARIDNHQVIVGIINICLQVFKKINHGSIF